MVKPPLSTWGMRAGTANHWTVHLFVRRSSSAQRTRPFVACANESVVYAAHPSVPLSVLLFYELIHEPWNPGSEYLADIIAGKFGADAVGWINSFFLENC